MQKQKNSDQNICSHCGSLCNDYYEKRFITCESHSQLGSDQFSCRGSYILHNDTIWEINLCQVCLHRDLILSYFQNRKDDCVQGECFIECSAHSIFNTLRVHSKITTWKYDVL